MARRTASVGVFIAVCLAAAAPLMLSSCGGEDKPRFSDAAAGSAGTGGLGVSGASSGSAGMDGTGGSTAGSGGNANGGVAGGGGVDAGGKSGSGGTGGASGASGNGGTGGAPVVRVYTIEGCDDADVGGAGGATGAGGAGEGGAGGASEGGAGGASEGGTGGAVGAGGESVGGEGGAGGPGPSPDFSATFTVFDFVTDDAVETCEEKTSDFNVTITGDAPLTVVTEIAGVTPASVIFTYDGVAQGVHNLAPYSLGPDDAGNYDEPTPPLAPGVHTLTITAYDAPDGMGNVLGTATIKLTVIDGDA